MPLHPNWQDICVRLALTMIAGAIIGFNRGARGHAAGFRTTILVGLAASVAMIQANLLLSLGGKTPDSFAEMDLMRLPLGILTGVGFIGRGAILRRGDLVAGVTTAATLWVMTVIRRSAKSRHRGNVACCLYSLESEMGRYSNSKRTSGDARDIGRRRRVRSFRRPQTDCSVEIPGPLSPAERHTQPSDARILLRSLLEATGIVGGAARSPAGH